MDVGGATGWSMDRWSPSGRSSSWSRGATVRSSRSGRRRWAPAERFRLADGTVFGIIASTTAPFCRTCDRGRLTADGTSSCLYGEAGLDLREPLRGGAATPSSRTRSPRVWRARDRSRRRGALALADRGVLHQIESLRADPRREMHTRGG